MIDRTLKHYRIIAALGAGGMGEVYLAEDTKLDRKVALKILPADVASNRDRMERFVREAKAAAALNHPNIAHIYEIGDSEGTPFIAMEYVDGVTLREKIHHSGEPLAVLVGYLAQVAEGLAKAHHAGIVHRDLKPDNVMITRDGYAKILDFGLAKLVESRGPLGIDQAGSDRTIGTMQQSTPGMVLGTIGYMSPEQASGRVHEIDHRSDIFSFGCLLFEATTGQMAFEGKDALDSLHKIVHAPTPQVKDVSRVAPDALQRVIGRCLAKDPARRYQSIKDLAIEVDDLRQELKSLTGPVSSDQPSVGVTPSGASRADEGFWVAVLPFKHRGAHADLEALADGLGEDIVMGLMRFSHLRVVSRSSTRRFSGEAVDIRTVGRELGARYVMEGSLRQAGSTLRVAVQLVDATTGAHLWAETYDRAFSPEAMFALQDDLVPRIVSTVADWYGVLPHSMSEAVRLKPLDQLTPYEALLRSFGYFERVVPAEHAAARSALERAVRAGAGQCRDLGDAVDVVRGGTSLRVQRRARSARACTAGRAAGGGGRALQSLRAARDGAGALLPQGIRCLPQRRRASPRAQPDGRGQHGVPGPLAGICRRLEAGLRAGGEGAASQSASPGVVLGPSLPRRVSQGRLRGRARLHPQGRHAGAVLLTVTARGRVRPAGRTRGGRRQRERGAGAQARLPPDRPRGVCEVVPAGAGRTIDRGTAQGGLS